MAGSTILTEPHRVPDRGVVRASARPSGNQIGGSIARPTPRTVRCLTSAISTSAADDPRTARRSAILAPSGDQTQPVSAVASDQSPNARVETGPGTSQVACVPASTIASRSGTRPVCRSRCEGSACTIPSRFPVGDQSQPTPNCESGTGSPAKRAVPPATRWLPVTPRLARSSTATWTPSLRTKPSLRPSGDQAQPVFDSGVNKAPLRATTRPAATSAIASRSSESPVAGSVRAGSG